MERQRDVAGGMGQIPADDRAGPVAGLGQTRDRQRLTGREVHAVEDDEREGRAVLRDGRLEVLDPDRVLAGPRSDRDEVRVGVESAPREVAAVGVAVRREDRRIGQDASSRPGRAEERGEHQLEVDGQRVEDRDLARTRAHEARQRARGTPRRS